MDRDWTGTAPSDRRSSWRHPVALHVDYDALADDGARIRGQGVTRDINESGVSLVAFDRLPDKSELDLTITAADRTVCCRGMVRSQSPAVARHALEGPVPLADICGIEFIHPDKEQLDALWWMGAQFAVGLHYERFSGGQFGLGPVAPRKLPKRLDEWKFELPVAFRLDDGRTVVAATETLGADTMTVLMSDALSTAKPIRLELATPFGRVVAWAELVDTRSRTVAGRSVQEARFRFCEIEADSRAVLEATLDQRGSKKLAPVIHSMPQRRPPESLRTAGIVMGTTGIAAAIVIGCVLFFKLDDVAIARAEAGRYLTQGQLDRLAEMVRHVHMETEADEARVLRLRSAMVALDREADVQRIDEAIADSDPKGIEGQILKAASLQNLKRGKEAEAIYRRLLAKLEQFYDDHQRWEFVLAAARNASNLGDLPEAMKRYKELEQYGALTDAARIELAGVLFRVGRAGEAELLLAQGSPTFEDLELLGSIYASTKQFSKAVGIYRQMLAMRPDDQHALLGLADNLSWSHDYQGAAKIYRQLLELGDNDEDVQARLAAALLYGKHYEESLRAYAALLERSRERQDLWNGFLMAAAGSPVLRKSDQALLDWIYQQRGSRNDAEFLKNLASAIAKHGSPKEAVALMQTLLDRSPRDADLRLQLADALYQLKRFDEADAQYRWLLAETEPPAALHSLPAEPAAPGQ